MRLALALSGFEYLKMDQSPIVSSSPSNSKLFVGLKKKVDYCSMLQLNKEGRTRNHGLRLERNFSYKMQAVELSFEESS